MRKAEKPIQIYQLFGDRNMQSSFPNTVEAPPGKELKGWHVFLMMLVFFGIMFTANGIFLYHAITSFPGEDVKKSYVQGLDYNRTLEARKTQHELGWSAFAGFEDGVLIFHLTDAEGEPVYAHDVEADIRHAATINQDRTAILSQSSSGEYAAYIENLSAGQWTVRFRVRSKRDGQIVFRAQKEMTILP